MTSERLFNSFIHPLKLLYPPKQISGYALVPGKFNVFTTLTFNVKIFKKTLLKHGSVVK